MGNIILPEVRIGNKAKLHPIDQSLLEALDPRGIIYLFEPPNPRAQYSLGCDPTHGRSGWTRYNRSEDDNRIDNGAIEVIKRGRGVPCKSCNLFTYKCASETPLHYIPDIQVAEYAAPIDPYDLASVCNALGRMYCGRDEDAQAPVIIEVYPGPGGPTQRTLMEKFGYTNLYRYQYMDGVQAKRKDDFGWYSGKVQVQHLWTKGLRYLTKRGVILRSPHLVEELADCQMDLIKLRGAAAYGLHDDRVVAMLLAIWQAHGWRYDMEADTTTRAELGPAVEWQRSDVSSDRMREQWDERFEQIMAEAEAESY